MLEAFLQQQYRKEDMKKVLGIVLASAFMVGALTGSALAADGKSLYSKRMCVTCHQMGGKGTGPFPKLAGKDSAFLQEQFTAIQNGTRTTGMSATMKANPGVQKVTAEEMAAIAGYLAAL